MKLDSFSQIAAGKAFMLKGAKAFPYAFYHQTPVKEIIDFKEGIQEKQREKEGFYLIPDLYLHKFGNIDFSDKMGISKQKLIRSHFTTTQVEEKLHITCLSSPKTIINFYVSITCILSYDTGIEFQPNVKSIALQPDKVKSKYNVGDKVHLLELLEDELESKPNKYEVALMFHCYYINYAKVFINGEKRYYIGYIVKDFFVKHLYNSYYTSSDRDKKEYDFILLNNESYPMIKIFHESANYNNAYNIAYDYMKKIKLYSFGNFADYEIV